MKYNTKQKTLFNEKTLEQKHLDIINKKYNLNTGIKILDKIDWDFKDFNTQYLTHKIHSYPARFIPQIPLTFIKIFTKEGDMVLDPMCGCGTTLFEAFLNNRDSIGNDFNPLAVLISKVKITLVDEIEINYLNRKLRVMKRYLDLDYKRVEKRIENLPNRKISKIFNKMVISKLESIREILLDIKKAGYNDVFDLGRVALSSTIWSLVEGVNSANIDELFLKKVKVIRSELTKMSKIVKNIPKVNLIKGDSRKLEVKSNSIDLIVTSPPYVNALDYYRVHMYNMLWLGLDFDLFKKHEIGGHSHFVTNRFRLLSEYLGDMLRSIIEMNRVLKKNNLCVIVVGNSSLEYELIESYKFFSNIAKDVGFKPIKHIFRNIDKTKKYTSADIGKIDDEYILVMQKIRNTKVNSNDNKFIEKIVKEQMLGFREKIKKKQGTSIRGRKPTKKRLLKNIDKISDAIENISQDIKIKV